jgi:hypothetical protein
MTTLRYRGREIHPEDILHIRVLIEQHPGDSRRKLSTRLCEDWDWRQSNGALRDMVCRGLLLMLDRAGEIALPPVTYKRHNPLAQRVRPEPVLVGAQGRPIACLAWSSAPRHLGSRDRYIGWSAEARRRNIRFLAYNTRFLILPWVRVEHLASHILGRMAAKISDDWQRMYGHPIYFLETFVDPERFRGTCYRAANWVVMGQTTGRGKQSNSYVPNRSIKEVLGYPLTRRFRELL